MSKKINEKLMKMGEIAFWEEFKQEEERVRHVIVDAGTGKVIASDAKLKSDKKKIEV